MAIMNDGFIYVVSGYRIFKVDPANGTVVKTLKLPTLVHMRNNYPDTPPTYDPKLTEDAVNTSYNGINALPDGTIVVKSLYRVAGCKKNGPSALLECPNAQDVPRSILVSVDPNTMQIIDKITLPAPAGARPTITRYRGVDYVYLLENTSNAVRYSVHDGCFTRDTGWTPAAVPYSGQTTGGSLIVMNDWVVGATNAIPAAGALTVFAINQGDAKKVVLLQPYLHDPIPPELSKAFADKAQGGGPAISWADMSLEADPENGLFYGVETLARKVAAFKLTGLAHHDRVEEDPDHHRVGDADRPEGSPRLGRHRHPRGRDPWRERDRQGGLPRRGHGSGARALGEGPAYDPGKRGSARLRRERVLPRRRGHPGQADAVPWRLGSDA